jgi:hypothetical protein
MKKKENSVKDLQKAQGFLPKEHPVRKLLEQKATKSTFSCTICRRVDNFPFQRHFSDGHLCTGEVIEHKWVALDDVLDLFSCFCAEQEAKERNFFAKELSLRKPEIRDKIREAINNIIEERFIRISQKGRMKYFSWDEAFLSQKDTEKVLKVFDGQEIDKTFVVVPRKQLSEIYEFMVLGRPANMAEETEFDKGYSKGYYDAKDQIEEKVKELLAVSGVGGAEKLKEVSGKES